MCIRDRYWGARRPADLYMDAWAKEQAQRMPNLTYVPVVSDALPEDHWQGRTGFVHRAVLQDFPDLSACLLYTSPSPRDRTRSRMPSSA